MNTHCVCSLAFLAIAITVNLACGAGSNPTIRPQSDVYAAGFEINDTGYSVARYWKNGALVVLTTGTHGSYAMSIAVSGSDVYVAGIESNGTNDVAKYWKNGVSVELTDGTHQGFVNSIFVDGTDLYVAGGETEPGITKSKYWKNGVPVVLENGEMAQSILVSGTDVYVAGWRYKTTQIDPTHSVVNPVAMYWRNGTPTELTDGLNAAFAFSISVSGTNVYVGGYACQTMDPSCAIATYWKNGTPVQLTTLTNSDVVSIFATGTDVYATGNQSNNLAEFWKNGVLTPLTSASTESGANQMVVSGSDVYIGGGEIGNSGQGIAGYWKNGAFVPVTDGTHFASAFGLAVVTH